MQHYMLTFVKEGVFLYIHAATDQGEKAIEVVAVELEGRLKADYIYKTAIDAPAWYGA